LREANAAAYRIFLDRTVCEGLQAMYQGTPVTDAGLKEIAGLKSLKLLNGHDTKVTEKGLAELKKD
jgi:hypothetical protein